MSHRQEQPRCPDRAGVGGDSVCPGQDSGRTCAWPPSRRGARRHEPGNPGFGDSNGPRRGSSDFSNMNGRRRHLYSGPSPVPRANPELHMVARRPEGRGSRQKRDIGPSRCSQGYGGGRGPAGRPGRHGHRRFRLCLCRVRQALFGSRREPAVSPPLILYPVRPLRPLADRKRISETHA